MKGINSILMVVVLLSSCSFTENSDIGKPDNYIIYESYSESNCSVYSMIFKNGDCLFHYAMSGSCENIMLDDYIGAYKKMLTDNDILLSKKGTIVFDYYSIQNKNDTLINLILDISKSKFNKHVSVTDAIEGQFILRVFKE